MTEFNVNEEVRVKLTDFGRKIHRQNYDRLMADLAPRGFPYTPPKEDEQGYSSWQLWSLMQEFGEYVSLAGPNPFKATILLSESKPAAPPASWAELEAKCLDESVPKFGEDARIGIQAAFAFLARHLPPASVCLAAGKELERAAQILDRLPSVMYVMPEERRILEIAADELRKEAALKAAEGGD